DQIEHIFKEFHRVRHNNTDNRGLGLGLAIARRLGLLLQHPIKVQSSVGKGTFFTVCVPRTSAPVVIAPPALPEPVAPALSSLTLFCVDNEPIILHSIESLLRQW